MADSAKSKSGEVVAANAGRETDEVGKVAGTLTVGCEEPAIAHEQVAMMEEAEASRHEDNNKRVEEARRARVMWLERLRRECGSEEEFETARSQPTWTELDSTSSSSSSSCVPDGPSPADLELMLQDNRLHFQHLLDTQHCDYHDLNGSPGGVLHENLSTSGFYVDIGDRLELGPKIGGGAQADIYRMILDGEVIDWWVLKVFRSEYSLADLQRSWTKDIGLVAKTCGHLDWTKDIGLVARTCGYLDSMLPFCCTTQFGTLLRDGRFAFGFERCRGGDLRKAIDMHIVEDRSHKSPPYHPTRSFRLMYCIASGLMSLHSRGILHKDLKAANCLLRYKFSIDTCQVADFDSSEGVVGTGFWRAPEVLLALKNRVPNLHSNGEIWTTKADVYSYAMTCYEILTGCIPFEDRGLNDYDVIISGERPPLPDYVDPKLQKLIRRCWHFEPLVRPTFSEILEEMSELYLIQLDPSTSRLREMLLEVWSTS